MELNVWNKWGRLRSVVLGSMYPPEFFDPIKDQKVREPLKWVCEEATQELQHFEDVLKSEGVDVLRPTIDPTLTVNDSVDQLGAANTNTAPPLVPRDHFAVVGNKGYAFSNVDPSLYKLFVDDLGFQYLPDTDLQANPNTHMLGANIFPVGRDIYVNKWKNSKNVLQKVYDRFETDLPKDTRVHLMQHDGHSDSGFHPIKPGAFLTLHHPEYYVDTYPGWDPCFLENESWSNPHVRRFLKHKWSGSAYYIPGQERNDSLRAYVNRWLTDWVGNIEETVFDVNVLMLDENNMFASSLNNPKVLEFAKKHDINIIHIPWTHRYFFDGGIHCITQELYRDGGREDYWPEGRDTINQLESPDAQ